jgi:hypothetical protein
LWAEPLKDIPIKIRINPAAGTKICSGIPKGLGTSIMLDMTTSMIGVNII